jgi:glycosyltransferase involved in cell wall biosynthesis
VYVSASKIENQSMSMIEAMAHGLPIVATNKRGVAELVDEKNGIPVSSGIRPLAIGVLSLFRNEELRKKLSHGSIIKSKEHFTSHTVHQLEREYVRIVHDARK